MKIKVLVLRRFLLSKNLRSIVCFSGKIGKFSTVVRAYPQNFPLKFEPFSLTEFEVKFKDTKVIPLASKLLKARLPESLNHLSYMSRVCSFASKYALSPSAKLFELIDFYLDIKGKFDLAFVMFALKFLYIEGVIPELKEKSFSKFIESENLPRISRQSVRLVCELTQRSFDRMRRQNFGNLDNLELFVEKLAESAFGESKTTLKRG